MRRKIEEIKAVGVSRGDGARGRGKQWLWSRYRPDPSSQVLHSDSWIVLQDLSASLMTNASLSLHSCAIYQICCVRKLVRFVQSGSWFGVFLFMPSQKRDVSVFSSTSFPSTLPLTGWPWYCSEQIFEDWNYCVCSGPFPFLQLYLPEMHPVQGWRSARDKAARQSSGSWYSVCAGIEAFLEGGVCKPFRLRSIFNSSKKNEVKKLRQTPLHSRCRV